MRTKYWSLSLAALLLGGMALAADDFEAKRAEMLNRKREIIYNTDGCDAIYYPRELAASKENFINRRLVYTQGTAIDSVFYCPLSSGFGHLTYRTTAGDQLLADPPHAPKMRNVTGELLAMGTDPLKIAEEYCREQGLEFFASLRVNDTHDQGHTEEKPMFLMSPFKRQHPEFLLGSKAKPPPPPAKKTNSSKSTWTSTAWAFQPPFPRLRARSRWKSSSKCLSASLLT